MDVPVPLTLPDGLKVVNRQLLEEYVLSRIRQFSQVYTSQLLGEQAGNSAVDVAFNNAVSLLGTTAAQAETFFLRFTHKCKFLACVDKECSLCNNNPNKRCDEDDNFDECYANDQVLRSKCEADVFMELVSASTGKRHDMSGFEVQLSVIDGESVQTGAQPRLNNVKELLKSDEGNVLVGSYMSATGADANGRLHMRLTDGQCRLPDIHVKDKNDTFHLDGHTYSSFRLMGVAIQRDMYGHAVLLDNIVPAVSQKFNVKTQRALNDYRKSEYPHYRDELTKLKFIGSITATRLRDIQAHVSDVPFTAIETVEQMKHLLLYADQNRAVENKLLDLLNMKGKHKHKWDYLREILNERIVYDDILHRGWFTDETMSQGLLYACKQGQVTLEKPFGLAQRAVTGGVARLQVLSPTDMQSVEVMKAWKAAAEAAWQQPGHPGWAVVSEQLELVNAGVGGGVNVNAATAVAVSRLGNGRSSVGAPMDLGDGMSPTHRASSPHGFPSLPSPLHAALGSVGAPDSGGSAQMSFAPPSRSGSAHHPRSPRHPAMATAQATSRELNDPFGSFAVASGDFDDQLHDPRLDLNSLRVSSSPAMMLHGNYFAGLRQGSGASEGGPGPDFTPGCTEPWSPNPPRTSPASRLRRMSASQTVRSAGGGGGGGSGGRASAAHSGDAMVPTRDFDEGLLDLAAQSKRPRSNVPSSSCGLPPQAPRSPHTSPHIALSAHHSPPLDQMHSAPCAFQSSGGGGIGMDSIGAGISLNGGVGVVGGFPDDEFDIPGGGVCCGAERAPSLQQLYHQESHGRHLPRGRQLEGIDSPMSPRSLLLQQHAAAVHNGNNGNNNNNSNNCNSHRNTGVNVDAMDNFLAAQLPAYRSGGGGSGHVHVLGPGRGELPSPSTALSDSMRRSLDLSGSGSARAHPGHLSLGGMGGVGDFGPPSGGGGGGYGASMSDSFNKQLTRILKHSESDSFKHLLDNIVDMSPGAGGLPEADQQREFAAFLDEFAGSTQA
ncbi:hypothetical protein FOA52_009331 [Chlamydomonas sp. UWO 241]|nr:hypothetical protein FOA52_009331 [Chlamydomonas sp. UWO 241]